MNKSRGRIEHEPHEQPSTPDIVKLGSWWAQVFSEPDINSIVFLDDGTGTMIE